MVRWSSRWSSNTTVNDSIVQRFYSPLAQQFKRFSSQSVRGSNSQIVQHFKRFNSLKVQWSKVYSSNISNGSMVQKFNGLTVQHFKRFNGTTVQMVSMVQPSNCQLYMQKKVMNKFVLFRWASKLNRQFEQQKQQIKQIDYTGQRLCNKLDQQHQQFCNRLDQQHQQLMNRLDSQLVKPFETLNGQVETLERQVDQLSNLRTDIRTHHAQIKSNQPI